MNQELLTSVPKRPSASKSPDAPFRAIQLSWRGWHLGRSAEPGHSPSHRHHQTFSVPQLFRNKEGSKKALSQHLGP